MPSRLMPLSRGLWSVLVLALTLWAAPLRAEAAQLARLLQTDALFEILAREGAVYGEELAGELFEVGSDPAWRAQVAAINDPARLRPLFDAAFAAALQGAPTGPITAFLDGDLGHRVVTLEIEARRALLDPAVDDRARALFETALAGDDPRAAAVLEFITAADLLEPNVAGGLNANLAFYRALVAGGGFPYAVSEQDMLADVRAQEPEVRAEMQGWLGAYLFMAYGPLSDAELQAYRGFAASQAGRQLTLALFAGFDIVFQRVSWDLGAATAQRLSGQDL